MATGQEAVNSLIYFYKNRLSTLNKNYIQFNDKELRKEIDIIKKNIKLLLYAKDNSLTSALESITPPIPCPSLDKSSIIVEFLDYNTRVVYLDDLTSFEVSSYETDNIDSFSMTLTLPFWISPVSGVCIYNVVKTIPGQPAHITFYGKETTGTVYSKEISGTTSLKPMEEYLDRYAIFRQSITSSPTGGKARIAYAIFDLSLATEPNWNNTTKTFSVSPYLGTFLPTDPYGINTAYDNCNNVVFTNSGVYFLQTRSNLYNEISICKFNFDLLQYEDLDGVANQWTVIVGPTTLDGRSIRLNTNTYWVVKKYFAETNEIQIINYSAITTTTAPGEYIYPTAYLNLTTRQIRVEEYPSNANKYNCALSPVEHTFSFPWQEDLLCKWTGGSTFSTDGSYQVFPDPSFDLFPFFYNKNDGLFYISSGAMSRVSPNRWSNEISTAIITGSNSSSEHMYFGDEAMGYVTQSGQSRLYLQKPVQDLINGLGINSYTDIRVDYGYVYAAAQTAPWEGASTTGYDARSRKLWCGRADGTDGIKRITYIDYTNHHPNLVCMWEDPSFTLAANGEAYLGICMNVNQVCVYPLTYSSGYIGL